MSIYDIDPNAPKPWGEHWEEIKQQGSGPSRRPTGRKRARSSRWKCRRQHRLVHEGKEYNFVSATDITQRKRMEKKFRLTQYSVDHASGQVFWVGPDGILTYASESTCKALGYTRDEMLCMSIYDIDPQAPRPWADHWKELKDQGAMHL